MSNHTNDWIRDSLDWRPDTNIEDAFWGLRYSVLALLSRIEELEKSVRANRPDPLSFHIGKDRY